MGREVGVFEESATEVVARAWVVSTVYAMYGRVFELPNFFGSTGTLLRARPWRRHQQHGMYIVISKHELEAESMSNFPSFVPPRCYT